MRIAKKRILLAILVVLAYNYFMPESTNAQSWFYTPDDHEGIWAIDMNQNILTISGLVYDDNPPTWDQLVDYDSKCFNFKPDTAWWRCANRGNPGGWVNSESFRYVMRVEVEPGCEHPCLSIRGRPDIEEICFKNKHVLTVYIEDECGQPLETRDITDIDEYITFGADLRYYDTQGYAPPAPTVYGFVEANGRRTYVTLYRQSDPTNGLRHYEAGILYKPRELAGGGNGPVRMTFSASYIFYASTFKLFYDLSDIFTVDSLIFDNAIAIDEDLGAIQTACLPYNSFISFGENILVNSNAWPSQDCSFPLADVNAYLDGSQGNTTAGTILPEHFKTSIAPASYQLPEGDPGQYVTLSLRWTLNVDGGPQRDIHPFDSRVVIYNGFNARIPECLNPTENLTIPPGYTLQLKAMPNPNLKLDDWINYTWQWRKGDNKPGMADFNPRTSTQKTTAFTSTLPGDYLVSYDISDGGSAQTVTSPDLAVHVKVNINIVVPSEDYHKYCFEENGMLEISLLGTTDPSEFVNDLLWDISPIEGTNIIALPDDRRGPEMDFHLIGLPESNDEFGDFEGRNWVKAAIEINDHVYDTLRPITLFYLKDALYQETEGNKVANWFHYWKQGAVTDLTNCLWANDGRWWEYGHYTWESDIIMIYQIASETCDAYSIPGLGIQFARVEGIDCAKSVCIHEMYHREI